MCVRAVTVEQGNAGVQDRCAAVRASSPVTLPALPKVTPAHRSARAHTHAHTERQSGGM